AGGPSGPCESCPPGAPGPHCAPGGPHGAATASAGLTESKANPTPPAREARATAVFRFIVQFLRKERARSTPDYLTLGSRPKIELCLRWQSAGELIGLPDNTFHSRSRSLTDLTKLLPNC